MNIRNAFAALLILIAMGVGNTSDAQSHASLTNGEIDHMIRAEWHKHDIVPAPPADDARFLRRIYLDILGTIPSQEAVRAFLADRSPDKRTAVVETLLNDPRYAENWTNYWDNVLIGRSVRAAVVDRAAFRQWLQTQFQQNVPWNKFVYDLLTATGQNSAGGSYARSMGLMAPNDPVPVAADTSQVNGAVNFMLKYAQTPADLSGTVSKVFLGVQIQCAQCHDHKTEKWKQADFQRFTACFVQTRAVPVAMDAGIKGIRRLEVRDVLRPYAPRRGKAAPNFADYVQAVPTALDGTEFTSTPNRRQALAAWITAPENPWFAKAIVNRVWAHFLGRGFVEPIDDFRVTNPPVMQELLDKLAADFQAHDYDLKRLIRTICSTQVYQLSSSAAKKSDLGNTLWERFRLKPMTPESMVDSLVTATNLQPLLEKLVGARLDAVKFGIRRQFTFLFDTDEETEQKDFEGTIPQALMLLNGNLLNNGASAIPGTALSDTLASAGGDADHITALYLRTVSRKPTPAELKRWTAFVDTPREVIVSASTNPPPSLPGRRQAGTKPAKRDNGPDPLARLSGKYEVAEQTSKQQAYEDLFWALLNSSEFMFNH